MERNSDIKDQLQTTWAGQHILQFQRTDSTNTQARKQGEEGGAHGTLIVADSQDAGKGRRGRFWESPDTGNIYMSLLLRPDTTPSKAPMLTLVMAQSVAEAVRQVTSLGAKIKWPNDIVVNGKKVCGILTEMSTGDDGIRYVVIGVGINVENQEFPEELQKMATSLYLESGKHWSRAELIAPILERFEENYRKFMERGDLSCIRKDYNDLLINANRQVRVLEPGHEYEGRALGISSTGELIVKRDDGREEVVFAGEVSVRGIYGYV